MKRGVKIQSGLNSEWFSKNMVGYAKSTAAQKVKYRSVELPALTVSRLLTVLLERLHCLILEALTVT